MESPPLHRKCPRATTTTGFLTGLAGLVSLVSLVTRSPAQDPEDLDPPVTFRIVCLQQLPDMGEVWAHPIHLQGMAVNPPGAKPGESEPGARVNRAGEPEPVPAAGALDLPQRNLSPWLRARPLNGVLQFFERAPVEDPVEPAPEGTPPPPAPRPLARVVLPNPSPRELYLVFSPAEGQDGKPFYQVAVIDASRRAFPASTHLLLNLSSRPVRGRFGLQQFEVHPGARAQVPEIKKTNERGYFEVQLMQAVAKNSDSTIRWDRLAWTQWKADPTSRRLCLVYDDQRRRRPAIRTFNEALMAREVEALPIDPRKPPPDATLPE